MTRRAALPLEPRLLDVERAAAYCGVSPNTFRQWCPVKPISRGMRKLYDRAALDRWIDSLATGVAASGGDTWADYGKPQVEAR